MARTSQDVTQAELAVLEALWAMDTATIRQLTDELYPSGSASSFSSVQKLLERLQSKGFVNRKRSGSVSLFRARIDRQELIGRRLKAVADSLCDGSMTPLLQHLVEAQHLALEDRNSLQELIDQWDDDTKTDKRPRSS